MSDTPKTLTDVKALLEEAVQVVSDLEAEAVAPASDVPADTSGNDADDQAVDADKAQLANEEAKDQADDATEAPEADTPPTA